MCARPCCCARSARARTARARSVPSGAAHAQTRDTAPKPVDCRGGVPGDPRAAADPCDSGLRLLARCRRHAGPRAGGGSGAGRVRGIRVENDDYPWPDGATLSPQGYYFKECVDFVAWRLNRDAGATATGLRWTWRNLTPGAGSARSWSSAWSGQGRVTSDTPVVGAVAWFTYNHVAYVQSVPGEGTVVLEEYNWMGSHAYHTRVVSIEDVALYLYPPS